MGQQTAFLLAPDVRFHGIDDGEDAGIASKKTRRTFMKNGSTSAAALVSRASARPGGAAAVGGKDRDGMLYLCVTCGTQFAESAQPPARCPICEDERQYVHPDGQQWTTLEALRATHRNVIKREEPDLYWINTEPSFGIGQRAFLIQAPRGNILWDCVSLLDSDTIARINELGGIAEIAISHPHYYTTMVEWSRAFGGATVHLHEAERQWVMRHDPCVRYWTGQTLALGNGLTLVSTGGHFEGYQVLHWAAGAEGKGALMAGDQPQICMDPRQVTFMYSYPNYIPLNASAVRHIVACLEPLAYDRIYGAFFIRGKGIIPSKAKDVVQRSAHRYLRAIQG
jgi:hypothetical protein